MARMPSEATIRDVVRRVAEGTISPDDAETILKKPPVRFGVARKGGMSVYGLYQSGPITHFVEQWLWILDHGDEIRAFLKENWGQFTHKKMTLGKD